MTKLLRFKDLKERGIVTNWPTVKRWIDALGFPPGKHLGPQTRVWTEAEIEAWIASRPSGTETPCRFYGKRKAKDDGQLDLEEAIAAAAQCR